jgi:hypothetical protein
VPAYYRASGLYDSSTWWEASGRGTTGQSRQRRSN